jgi:hypothetical protein
MANFWARERGGPVRRRYFSKERTCEGRRRCLRKSWSWGDSLIIYIIEKEE